MFCKYCGTKLMDDAVFCHACGKATNEQPASRVQIVYQSPVQPVQPVFQQPVYQAPVQPVYQAPVQPAYDSAEAEKLQNQALTFGILGLSLSILGVPGIIFSSIAGSKASALKKLTGQLPGKARTGHGLAKAGKIVSIIMTVVWALTLPSLIEELIYAFDNPFEYFSF